MNNYIQYATENFVVFYSILAIIWHSLALVISPVKSINFPSSNFSTVQLYAAPAISPPIPSSTLR
jgi:hypothetical protein